MQEPKVTNKMLFDSLSRTLKHHFNIGLLIEESFGANPFPSNDCHSSGQYIIKFNRRLEMMLALYNLCMDGGVDIGSALMHYTKFYACMELDQYETARTHLEAFKAEIERADLHSYHLDGQEEIERRIVQKLFCLYHEVYHVLFRYNEEFKDNAFVATRNQIGKLRDFLAYDLEHVGLDEVLKDPRMQKHIDNMIPTGIYDRSMMKKQLGAYNPEYLQGLVDGTDEDLLEEISCDRRALNSVMAFDPNMSDDDKIEYHKLMYIALNAGHFNNVQQSHFRPDKHKGWKYDGRRIHARQAAFRDLLWGYVPDDKAKNVKFAPMNLGLETALREMIREVVNNPDEYVKLYQVKDRKLNFKLMNSLNGEMKEIEVGLLGDCMDC